MTERHGCNSQEDSDLLTVQEAATTLRVTDRTVQRYIQQGHLKGVRLPGGRLLRVRRADVEALGKAVAL
ncbi:helix-turn-helix domain-containing protein [Mycobacteroides abscessus]|uniref:helix-turn-helix domain-containing protein n=1 Tax=Mycobacteroides abscessus TaxID=36809 RepID=UPI000C26A2B9|nr:helix-turn-helix domain-containing protein [Mycobacteroides abscessus]